MLLSFLGSSYGIVSLTLLLAVLAWLSFRIEWTLFWIDKIWVQAKNKTSSPLSSTKPAIDYFEIIPEIPREGEPIKVRWQVKNAHKVWINGSPAWHKDIRTVLIKDEFSIFHLKAINKNGDVSSQKTITTKKENINHIEVKQKDRKVSLIEKKPNLFIDPALIQKKINFTESSLELVDIKNNLIDFSNKHSNVEFTNRQTTVNDHVVVLEIQAPNINIQTDTILKQIDELSNLQESVDYNLNTKDEQNENTE